MADINIHRHSRDSGVEVKEEHVLDATHPNLEHWRYTIKFWEDEHRSGKAADEITLFSRHRVTSWNPNTEREEA